MKRYDEAIEYLYGLQFHGIKLGLSNTLRLLSLLDNPQTTFKSIHIAGTNGKGSTSACIASILSAAGYRVGHFTSPHLVSFTERIRVNGEQISEADVIAMTNHIRDLLRAEKELSPTFFEFVTALGFQYFRQKGVEWAVVETGMGGRLDATNILLPEAAVITRIGLDHREFLGNTMEEIAGEKAGIIKEDTPVVMSDSEEEALEVLLRQAKEKRAPVSLYRRDFSSRPREAGIGGSRFDYVSAREIGDLRIPLPGEFQLENASLAVRTADLLQDSRISDEVIRRGLSSVRWEGRCELFRWRYPILFDGAHNPDAACSLRKALTDIFLKEFKNVLLIIGLMADKDIRGVLAQLLPLAKTTIFTTLGFQRAAKAEDLVSTAQELGFGAVAAEDMADALKRAEAEYQPGDLVVITGSFYALGEAKGVIGFDASLIGLAEFR